jgi:hypothetical protein
LPHSLLKRNAGVASSPEDEQAISSFIGVRPASHDRFTSVSGKSPRIFADRQFDLQHRT